MQLFVDATPGNFEKAMKEAESESGLKISCLLTDAFLWFACDMAEERRVPWVAFWAASPSSLSAHMCTDQIWSMMRSIGAAEREEKTLSFLPGMSSVRFSDLPGEILPENSESPLAIMIYKMFGFAWFDGTIRTLDHIWHVPDLKNNLNSLATLDSKEYKFIGGDEVLKVCKGVQDVW
ncbi:anthocyanidin 3-O-glucosyltransferase-like [Olea europaea var. sylvestris]|uniref:anthocyanidin 3-O-glucosyltransferase-like n=1 Tax=Olea europaea var. sylvestris TaxID=158386 RepID=UPI000C1D5FE2|nr:anthocyanidin 3-O-glucosyltransferase-like [Olea europaea var. sylvestris]